MMKEKISSNRRELKKSAANLNIITCQCKKPSHHHNSKCICRYISSLKINANEDKHNADEKRYWDRELGIAKWLNWLTAVAAAVALGGLALVYLSIVHADKATVDANRAWLAISWGGFDFVNPNVILKIKTYNVGKVPATDVYYDIPKVEFEDIVHPHIDGLVNNLPNMDFCEANNTQKGSVIYPAPAEGKTILLSFTIDTRTASRFAEVIAGKIAMKITGRAFYTTFRERHHVQYCFLEAKSPDNKIFGVDCKKGMYAN